MLSGMGRNNQQRRASKRRERARRASHARPSRPEQPEHAQRFGFDAGGQGTWSTTQVDEEAIARHEANQKLKALIAHAGIYGEAWMTRSLAHNEVLTAGSTVQQIMDEQLTARLLAVLTSLWEHGWQPADLLHVARRIDAASADLAAALIVAQASRLPMERAPVLWRSQWQTAETAAVAAGLIAIPPTAFSIVHVQLRLATPPVDAWARVLRLAAELEQLPPLAGIGDPPSMWTSDRRSARRQPAHGDRDKMMAKIRALLAKAEGTEYAAEAEALTAKAQDLMTRHAIDEALLHAHDEQAVDVVTLRMHLQAPYAAEKMTLLTQVAHSNRCKAIWLEQLAIGTLVGTPIDVDQVELLFTSLLIQATRAMAEAGAARPGSYDRSASFRRSFLVSYAVRIGERLEQAASAATADYGKQLVPVLKRQAHAVETEFERLFPHVYAMDSNRTYSQRGWEAGRSAADKATFVAGRLAPG